MSTTALIQQLAEDVRAAQAAGHTTPAEIAAALEPRISAACTTARRDAAGAAFTAAATDLTHMPLWYTPDPGADWETGIQGAATRVARLAEAAGAATGKDTRTSSMLAQGESTPLVVSRLDVVVYPAPGDDLHLTIGAVADTGRPVTLVLDHGTQARLAGWLGHTTPPRAYLARAEGNPAPLGWYSTPEAARAHCQQALSDQHPAHTTLAWDWVQHDGDDIAELLVTLDGREQPSGYSVITLDLPATHDPGADW
ncbi:hypothetical protein [Streptomyces sp. NPDC047968]|uniref:hypothetical protein n=1 Tax=unclassified Streptomyces TaxID=2593676 RepID=UPI0034425E5A